MKKRPIIFSSSEYSDSGNRKVEPKQKSKKIELHSDYSYDYYYSDYSDHPQVKTVSKPNKGPIRPIKQNTNFQQQSTTQRRNIQPVINQNQNLNQNKHKSDQNLNRKPHIQKSSSSLQAVNKEQINHHPKPHQLHRQPHKKSENQPINVNIDNQNLSSPSMNLPKDENYDIEYEYSQNHVNSQNSKEDAIVENKVNQKIYCSPHEMQVREITNTNNTPQNNVNNNNIVILNHQAGENIQMPNVASSTLTTSIHSPPISDQSYTPITYSIERTGKRSAHGKSYIFTLIKGGAPILYSKVNSKHPKGAMPISSNKDIHIRDSSKSDFVIIAENSCTNFIVKSPQNNILTFSINPSQNEFIILPHLNIAIDKSVDFEPKLMTSRRPQTSSRGRFFLDFHGKFTLASQKNAIFIPTNPSLGDKDLIVVRKIEKDRIEIDSHVPASDIIVFGIGLSSFLAKHPVKK